MHELDPIRYFDTSLRKIPGPKRTFDGPCNTGKVLPQTLSGIPFAVSRGEPIGLERLLFSERSKKVLHLGGRLMINGLIYGGYGMFVLSGVESFTISREQLWNIYRNQSSLPLTEFVLVQTRELMKMLIGYGGAQLIRGTARMFSGNSSYIK